MLIAKRIHKNYAPFFNEVTLVSVNLEKSEVMQFYNLDEIDRNPNPKPFYLIKQLALASVESAIGFIMNAHEFIICE